MTTPANFIKYCEEDLLTVKINPRMSIPHANIPGLTRTAHTGASDNANIRVEKLSEFPIHINSKLGTFDDPILQLLHEKDAYKTTKSEFMRHLTKKKLLKGQRLKFDNGIVAVPEYVIDVNDLHDKDPDEYFDSTYNWYYGGSLKTLTTNNETYLFSTSGAQLNRLNVFKPTTTETHPFVKLKPTSKLKYPDAIYQLDPFIEKNELSIAIRNKNHYQIKKFIHDNGVINDSRTISSAFSHVPIVSGTVNCHGQYAIIDAAKTLKIYNIQVDCCQMELKDSNKTTVDCWSAIEYASNNSILYLDRKHFGVFDDRIGRVGSELSLDEIFQERVVLPLGEKVTNVSDSLNVMKCDWFSCMTRSLSLEHGIYLGTYHSVVLADLRMMKHIVKTWTHSMKSTPAYAKPFKHNQTEYLYFASQLFPEKMIVNANPKTHTPPTQLPTFTDTLIHAKIHGYCLNPFAIANHIASYATNGVEILADTSANDSHLLSSNSRGDVFAVKLNVKLRRAELMRSVKALDETHGDVSVNGDGKLTVTSIATTTGYSTEFVRGDVGKTSRGCSIAKRTKKRQEKWQKSIGDLAEYRDILASELLAVWELTTPTQQVINVDVENSTERVCNWLTNETNEMFRVSQISALNDDGPGVTRLSAERSTGSSDVWKERVRSARTTTKRSEVATLRGRKRTVAGF